MKDAGSIIDDVSATMRACGITADASDKRDAARRRLLAKGINSYTDNTGLYYFNLEETHMVQVMGDGLVACQDCTGDSGLDALVQCRTCGGSKKVRPKMRLHINGFILSPEYDWKVLGFLVTGLPTVIGSRPVEVGS